MPKTEKLNLDDIDFDAAFGVETEEAPEGLELNIEDDDKDDVQPVADDAADVEDNEEDVSEDEGDPDSDEDEGVDTSDSTGDDSSDEDADEGSGDNVEELSLVDEIRTKLGFDIEGDFEDSPEGLIELAKASADKLAETQLNELFQAMPDVEQYVQFRLNGGDSAQFFQTFYNDVNYETLKVEEEDINMQEHLVRQAMELKGFEADDIKESVQEFRNSGILFSQAQKAQKGLAKFQSREKERLVQEQERAAQEAQTKQQQFWGDVDKTIKTSSELRGIPISEKDKKELLDYVARPVKDGLSEFQIAMNEAPTDVYLAIAALMRRDFDLSGIVSRKAKTANAQSLRERVAKNKGKNRLNSKGQPKKGSVKEPDFDALDLTI